MVEEILQLYVDLKNKSEKELLELSKIEIDGEIYEKMIFLPERLILTTKDKTICFEYGDDVIEIDMYGSDDLDIITNPENILRTIKLNKLLTL